MTYNEILKYFPRRIASNLEEYLKQNNNLIEEIRLRSERPIIIKHSKGEEILKITVSINEILETLQHICDNSIYTYQNQSSLRNLDISTPCNLKTSPKVVGLSFLSI